MAPKSTAQRQLAEDLRRLRDKLDYYRPYRITIEDDSGQRYSLDQILVMGGNTDDPGMVLKIRKKMRPDA